MATAVVMPRQGQSVESCLVTSINKKKGDSVAAGDILFSYETDKSSFDEEAKISGTVLELFIEEGDDVPCLETVLVIGKDGEDISEFAPEKSEKAEAMTPVNIAAGDVKISPRAKIYAEQAKIDLSKVVPTGPNGRIIERDVIEAVKTGERLDAEPPVIEIKSPEAAPPILEKVASAAGYTDVKLPGIRKVIAKAMHASLAEMAQLTLNSSFDAAAVLALRKRLKDAAASNSRNAEGGVPYENITLNDMVLYAVAKTLRNHKDANAHYLGDSIRYFDAVNLGVAVDTKRGLLVPTIFGADTLSLNELAKRTKQIIAEAQDGTIAPDKLKGGTFTVTNLGALGIESFTPVVNPPQTCILGVNNITRRIKQIGGRDVFYDCMGLSLTFDHRALDGAPAARFLQELCKNLEDFDLLLAR